jgi:DNA-directed RNA polymerase specialized sigma24 family protein
MTQEEIVAQHLHIADLTAGWAWVRRRERLRQLGIDREELGGMAALAFAEAASKWDAFRPHNGDAGLGPYLVQQTRWKLSNAIKRLTQAGRAPEEGSLVSLYTPLNEEDGSLADLVGEEDDNLERLEREDLLARVTQHVDPVDLECLRLAIGYDLTFKVTAERMRMSHTRVQQRVARGMACAIAAARAFRRRA